MRRTRRALPLLLAVAALGGLFATPADAVRRGSCIPGKKRPKCLVWTGKVMAVADGDTVNVRVWEGGHWSVRKDIRLLGLQAMELTDYSRKHGRRKGECHAVAAARRLEYLLQGPRVKRRKIRIASFRASSRTAGRRGRLRRGIAYKSGGHWHDVGAVLMREGHALWDPNGKEWAWNRRYAKLASRAALARRGIWDTDYCGSGPQEGAPLKLKVRWDAPHNDARHVNGEWISIRNRDPVNPLSLHRWWVRDSALRRFRLPRTAVVPPGRAIRVRVGKGSDNAKNFYWGQSAPVFENVKRGRRGIGDGAYLFDPQGDMRAWRMYPCRPGCGGPGV
jgi:endonuclease YncB( thermonuclease family)